MGMGSGGGPCFFISGAGLVRMSELSSESKRGRIIGGCGITKTTGVVVCMYERLLWGDLKCGGKRAWGADGRIIVDRCTIVCLVG